MRHRAISFACFLTLTAVFSSAQTPLVSTGLPPFGSFGGGPFDTVNVGNLNVHFAIPVLHKAGRGIPFTYDLSYDSSIWIPTTSSGTTQWQPVANWGWRGATEVLTGYVSYTQTQKIPSGCASTADVEIDLTNWVYHDSFGVAHPFPGVASEIRTRESCSSPGINPLGAVASDGSGYQLVTSSTNLFAFTLSSRSGRVLGVPVNVTTGVATLTDANGNEISVNGSGQFFDTLSSTTPVLTISSAAPPAATTFTYIAPSGANAAYTINYLQYTVKTAFGVSKVSEYGPTTNPLVSSITLPDGKEYSFTYETTPGACTPNSGTQPSCVTGRIASVKLPTGGTLTYTYSGGSNGIESDGSAAGLTRALSATVAAPAQSWSYTRKLVSGTPAPGSTWTTTVVDPAGNNTLINFAEDGVTSSSTTAAPSYNFYETQRQVYQGTISGNSCSSTTTNNCLLATTTRCYNGNYTSCSTATVSSPITQTDFYSGQTPNGSNPRLSEVFYNNFGLVTSDSEYDYGAVTGSAPGATKLVRTTTTVYGSFDGVSHCTALGNGVVDKPCEVEVFDSTSGTSQKIALTSFSYDQTTPTATSGTPQHLAITGSRGNLTTVTQSAGGSGLSQTISYFDTGTPNVASDVNGAQTTYVYGSGSCGNSFPTTINEPLSLSRSIAWNCTGGVTTQVTDENGNDVSSTYSDADFWRPFSATDQMGNQTNFTYTGPTAVESALQNFNSGNSASDYRATVDGFGRLQFNQGLQAPGGSTYDTSETDYNNLGEPSRTTFPYSAPASPSSSNTTVAANTTTYDALGRVLTVTDADGGTVTNKYTNNDILQTVGGTPSGTQSFQKQFEYDGLGRLTSVCEMTQAAGSGACGQSNQVNGYWTKYTYDALGRLLTVTQNAQASSATQTRTFTYDMLGRILSESNPETGNSGHNGTITYTYDSVSSCGGKAISSTGDLVQKTDNAANVTCYTYDGLHRVLTAGNSTISGATLRNFVYDTKASLPSGVSVNNGKGALIEAQTTTTSGSVITDEYFSYDARGELADVYESTPHSSGFYHTTAAYWPTGTIKALSGIPGVPAINYGAGGSGLDTEGRITQVAAASGTNPVTGVTYSTGTSTAPLGALTNVTFGSADSDSFTYDPNTGRLATYTFSVNGKTDVGALTWSANGTLTGLKITDSISGTADSQTCTYGYDDLQRVSGVACGTLWAQNFAYDTFGNVSKNVPSGDGGLSFLPTYWTSPPTNQFLSLPSATPKYDATGNLLTDNLNTYTWDANWGTLLTVDTGSTTVTATYDAFGRMVENNAGGSFTEIVYGPVGKVAKCSGQTLVKAFVGLPGGAVAIYNSTGLAYFRHSDHLGSSRLTSTVSRTMFSSSAYAPFGEQYATAGNADGSFTGQDQDLVSSLYSFPYRHLSSSQGRWTSPDPAGISAVDIGIPQSWNRYAYVLNNPLSYIDPDGTSDCDPGDDSCDNGGDGGAGGDGGDGGGGVIAGDGGDGGGGVIGGDGGGTGTDDSGVFTFFTQSSAFATVETQITVIGTPDDVPPPGLLESIFDVTPTIASNPSNQGGASNQPTKPPACQAKILNATNNRFAKNYTSANVSSTFNYSTGAPPGQGTLNLNISGSTAGISPGYYPVNWWTYAIGYGPTLHVVSGPGGHGGLDSTQTLPFSPTQATLHIDSGFPSNPIGAFFHWLLNFTKAGGYPAC